MTAFTNKLQLDFIRESAGESSIKPGFVSFAIVCHGKTGKT